MRADTTYRPQNHTTQHSRAHSCAVPSIRGLTQVCRGARLWNDVFVFAQERCGVPRGSIRATFLLETIMAAFEMDEMLYELR